MVEEAQVDCLEAEENSVIDSKAKTRTIETEYKKKAADLEEDIINPKC